MNMLEKAARAAAIKLQFRDFGHEDENGDWHMTAAQAADFGLACSEVARAVLAAIREPDEAMLAAAMTSWVNGFDRKSSTIYRAMIDAILEGESK
jgi:hypothetical protein